MPSRHQLPPLGEYSAFFPKHTIPLRAMLGSVGHVRIQDTSYDWDGLKRGRAEFSLIQYTLSGKGHLSVSTREYTVPPGTAMLLHFPDNNRYRLPDDAPEWHFLYVCLHGREVSRLWRNIEHHLGPLTELPLSHPITKCVARIVKSALTGKINHAFTASSLAYELVMTLSAETRNPRHQTTPRPELAATCDYAEQHLAAPLTVDDMARHASMSRYHFTRLFTAHTGLPPAAWLTEQRIKEAAKLLRLSATPIKEIASLCGFPNVNYFSRVFRQHTGTPPASYRRSGA